MEKTPFRDDPEDFADKLQEIESTKKYLASLFPASRKNEPKEDLFRIPQESNNSANKSQKPTHYKNVLDPKNPLYQFLKQEDKLFLLDRIEEEEKMKENRNESEKDEIIRQDLIIIRQITEQNDQLRKERFSLKNSLLEQNLRYKEAIKSMNADLGKALKKERETLENEIEGLKLKVYGGEQRIKVARENYQELERTKEQEIKTLEEEICKWRIEDGRMKEKERFYEGMDEKMRGLERTIDRLNLLVEILKAKEAERVHNLWTNLTQQTNEEIKRIIKEKNKVFEAHFQAVKTKMSMYEENALRKERQQYENRKELESEINGLTGALENLRTEKDIELKNLKQKYKIDLEEATTLCENEKEKCELLTIEKKELIEKCQAICKENEVLKEQNNELLTDDNPKIHELMEILRDLQKSHGILEENNKLLHNKIEEFQNKEISRDNEPNDQEINKKGVDKEHSREHIQKDINNKEEPDNQKKDHIVIIENKEEFENQKNIDDNKKEHENQAKDQKDIDNKETKNQAKDQIDRDNKKEPENKATYHNDIKDNQEEPENIENQEKHQVNKIKESEEIKENNFENIEDRSVIEKEISEKLKIEQEHEIKNIEAEISKTIRELKESYRLKFYEFSENHTKALEILQKNLFDRENEIEELKIKLITINENEGNLDVKEEEKSEKKEETTKKHEENNQNNSQNEDLTKVFEENVKKIEVLLNENKRINEENEVLKKEIERIKEENQTSNRENISVENLKSEIQNITKTFEAEKTQFELAKSQEIQFVEGKFKAEIEALTNENNKLNEENKVLRQDIEKKNKIQEEEMAKLMNQIIDLTDALNNEKQRTKKSFEDSKSPDKGMKHYATTIPKSEKEQVEKEKNERKNEKAADQNTNSPKK